MTRILLLSLLAALVVALPAEAKKPKKKKQQAYTVAAPELHTAADSVTATFGASQAKFLRTYVAQKHGVDSTYMGDFARGVMDYVSKQPVDSTLHAYFAGQEVGAQVLQITKQFSKEYYAADPDRELDPAVMAAALLHVLLQNNDALSDSAMLQLRTAMDARKAENQERLYGANREAGEAFLAENAQKEGVVTLPSGLQYKVLAKGDGAVPTATQKVKVNYEGHLIDGTEFDSSYKRNQPATFQANRVIAGWTEALCLMPVGSKWELYIPYQLAYGERETGKIKPYSALIFTVELLGIEEDTAK